jgi:hypothetical protein
MCFVLFLFVTCFVLGGISMLSWWWRRRDTSLPVANFRWKDPTRGILRNFRLGMRTPFHTSGGLWSQVAMYLYYYSSSNTKCTGCACAYDHKTTWTKPYFLISPYTIPNYLNADTSVVYRHGQTHICGGTMGSNRKSRHRKRPFRNRKYVMRMHNANFRWKGLTRGYFATSGWACAHPSTSSGDLRSQVAMVLVQLLQ